MIKLTITLYSIFSSKSLFFPTQLLLIIPVFELNVLFVFHQTWAINMQSILEFSQLIHDFLVNHNTVTPSVCNVSRCFGSWYESFTKRLTHFTVIYLLTIDRWFDSRAAVLVFVGMYVRHTNPIVNSINSNWNFASHIYDEFYFIYMYFLWYLNLFQSLKFEYIILNRLIE